MMNKNPPHLNNLKWPGELTKSYGKCGLMGFYGGLMWFNVV